MKVCLFILLVISAPGTIFSQSNSDICGIKYPVANVRSEYVRLFQEWKQRAKIGRIQSANYTIPVVFHLIQENPSSSKSQLSQLVASLNDAFGHRGVFGSGDQGVDTGIEFCLATRAPDGGRTSGITRITSDYGNFDMDLEDAKLKTIVQWDPRYYLNVWVVDQIYSEIFHQYTGKGWWTRFGAAGYATLPFEEINKGDFLDGIVLSSMDANLLAHECGHYLGLLHTFDGGCKNGDCLMDGDMVCDTPPDNSVFFKCEDNTCATDTLSNFSNNHFFVDVPDMTTNFMDYGNATCGGEFTAGQAERMYFHLENYRNLLYLQNPLETNEACQSPCEENLEIFFTQSLIKPTPADNVTFISSGELGDSFSWYVEHIGDKSANYSISMDKNFVPSSIPVATSKDLQYMFPAEGKYRIYLKTWNNSDPSCFASYSVIVRVICGVDARFWPDVRFIAAKRFISRFLEPVTFTNNSTGANAFEWRISHKNFISGQPDLPVFISNDVNLVYSFPEPGVYNIYLTATDGTCTDVSNTFTLEVVDPTIDGIPKFKSVDCYQVDSLIVALNIVNTGYDTINIGTPISFYNGDPRSTVSRLIDTKKLPNLVYGVDSTDFSFVIPNPSITELFVVFNDEGSNDFPISFPKNDLNVMSFNSEFPASGYAELNYENNVDLYLLETESSPFEDQWVCAGDSINLIPTIDFNFISFSSSEYGDIRSKYKAQTNDTISIIFENQFGCRYQDSFAVNISSPNVFLSDTIITIIKGGSAHLDASGGDYFLWTPPDGLSDPTSSSPIATPQNPIIYTVEVTDSIGCSSIGRVKIEIITTAYIPNLFTPNGDQRNDMLKVYGLENVASVEFKIFNRAGSLVFESSEANQLTVGWDGKWNGKDQPSGVYYWKVEGNYTNGLPIYLNESENGVIHLIR